jgi:hypothetical protein
MSGYVSELPIDAAKGMSPLHNIHVAEMLRVSPRLKGRPWAARSTVSCRAVEEFQTILCVGRLAIPPVQGTVPDKKELALRHHRCTPAG